MNPSTIAKLAAAALLLSLAGCGGNSDSSESAPSSDDSSSTGGTSSPSTGDTTPESSDGAGGDFADLPAADIVKAAKADMVALDSVHLAGTVDSDGSQITLDVTVAGDGDCEGTFSMAATGGSAQLVSVGGTFWLKPDAAFWRATAGTSAEQIIKAVGDKYVLFPPEQAGTLGDVCDISSIIEGDQAGASYEVTGTDQVDGQDVVLVKKTAGDQPGGVASILTGDKHWILKLENDTSKDKGTVVFDKFNEDFAPKAPAAADVVDLSTLGG